MPLAPARPYLAFGAFAVLLALLLGPVGAACAVLVLVFAYVWTQGLLVRTIEDIRSGDADLWIGTRFARLRPRLNALSLGAVLAGVGVAAGAVALVIPGILLATWWALLVPAVVFEEQGLVGAARR